MNPDSRGCLEFVKYWLFAPCADDDEEPSLPNYSEKRDVCYDQPRPTSPIRAAPLRPVSRGRQQQRQYQRQLASSRVDEMGWLDKFFFSRRRRTRRPPISISHPTNFQHTGTGAINFRASAQPFRRLELSIYEPNNQVSPLLPYFQGPNTDMVLPEAARTRDVFDDDGTTLHSRSHSDFSFHIPRRPVGDRASYSSSNLLEDSPPRIPPRSRTRPRAHTYTSPSVEAIVERIASAIIEKEILDAEIHSIKSRASMCLSRPSTAYDPDEPMPMFPVLPPAAPSFAERVSIDRPRTAPSSTQTALHPPLPSTGPAVTPRPRRTGPRPPPFPERKSSFKAPKWKPNQSSRSASAPESSPNRQAVRASAFNSHPPLASPKIIDNSIDISVPLAPPLPLILRPPLRKKKSFSRVSDWLFPADMDKDTSNSPGALTSFSAHKKHMSIDSVTNAPQALNDRDGYYQTLPPSALFSGPRRSFDSASELSRPLSGSIYSTDEEQTGHGPATVATVATSEQWSPGSTPPEEVMRQADSWKKNEFGLSFAMAVADRAGTGRSRQASDTERASHELDEEERPGRRMQAKRAPMHIRAAAPRAPRPTSVGVAF